MRQGWRHRPTSCAMTRRSAPTPAGSALRCGVALSAGHLGRGTGGTRTPFAPGMRRSHLGIGTFVIPWCRGRSPKLLLEALHDRPERRDHDERPKPHGPGGANRGDPAADPGRRALRRGRHPRVLAGLALPGRAARRERPDQRVPPAARAGAAPPPVRRRGEGGDRARPQDVPGDCAPPRPRPPRRRGPRPPLRLVRRPPRGRCRRRRSPTPRACSSSS